MVRKGLRNLINSLLISGAVFFSSVKEGLADKISVLMCGDGPANVDLGGSEIFLRNMEGGELGGDLYDAYWAFISRPPGSPPIWLRVYSDQVNQFYGISGYEQKTDARPYSGQDANKNFPLRFDIQYDNVPVVPVTASNCYVRFDLQEGPDPPEYGRRAYYWNMTLQATNSGGVAVFTDGTTNKSGIWNLDSDPRTNYQLPRYNLTNVLGCYGRLDVVPTNIVQNYQVNVVSRYEPWFGTNTIGNPSGAGQYPAGTSVTVAVDRYVVNPTNAGLRLRAREGQVSP